jgi:predicted dithiol-disulfide oxidoreductase (DUF899 family)/CubicO group peptidase (beta-lactamase class C family)
MQPPAIVSREDWLQARKSLLIREKEATRMLDGLRAERRALPWVKVGKTYVFETRNGPKTLAELFDGRSQLFVYHNMLTPDSHHVCPGCSLLSDHFDAARQHFEHADLSLVVVSRAKLDWIEQVRKRMGWRFQWVSSFDSDFNYDFKVSFTDAQIASGAVDYNFRTSPISTNDLHGESVFAKDDAGAVYHTYSSFARGSELLVGAFNFLDLAPKGRNEKSTMSWVRLHDEYEDAPKGASCCSSANARVPHSRRSSVRDSLAGYVDRGELPGLVALADRNGDTQIEAIGKLAFDSAEPMRADTLFRIASMSKPVTAVAAMILVEECKLRLDEPVDRLLPELANRKVLKNPRGPLEDTVPAQRALTLRDLLTLRQGFGYLMDSWDAYPIQRAAHAQGLLLGPPKPLQVPAPDEWMHKVGTLPLMYQPGERWMYDLGIELLSVLIARAARQPLDAFLRERILQPLGMNDTSFSVPADKLSRFATSYRRNAETGKVEVFDDPKTGEWSKAPAFPSGAGGLVSTAGDYLAFSRMLLNKGTHGGSRILSSTTVDAMTTNQLTANQHAGSEIFLGGNRGWGFGMSVFMRHDGPTAIPGTYGWDGGLGTCWRADPQNRLTGILLTQLAWTSPVPPAVTQDFWTSVYQSIDE